MFRRVVAQKVQQQYNATALQSRSYFFANPGEVGIWGRTMKTVCRNIVFMFACLPFVLYKVVFVDKGNTPRQFHADATELFDSDGTELEGEEAVASMRVYRERIMPFMDDYKDKIEAAGGSI